MERGKCFHCQVTAGLLRKQGCWTQCVMNEKDAAEAARLRDFRPLKSDGVDYTDTDHPRYIRGDGKGQSWLPSPGWADIISGKCKCKQCEQARFTHTVKQMVADSKKQLRNS